MSGRLPLSLRIAEESQLLAEEKWLKEALTKIRNQRNSLQIERLHLESMKAKMLINPDKKPPEKPPEEPAPVETMMQGCPATSQSRTESEARLLDDFICNTEQLNLGVPSYAFNPEPSLQGERELIMEEEYDDDEENYDDVLLDMNMLMHGISGTDTATYQ